MSRTPPHCIRFHIVYKEFFDLIKSFINEFESLPEDKKVVLPVSSFLFNLAEQHLFPFTIKRSTTENKFFEIHKDLNKNKDKDKWFTFYEEELKEIIKEENKYFNECYKIIHNFIDKFHKYWDLIYNKDISFIINNKHLLFEHIPEQYVNSFIELFNLKDKKNNKLMNDEKMNLIWRYFTSMVKISIKHIYDERKLIDNKFTKVYFPDINIKELIEKWDVKI
jgi:hypothetical protein